MRGIEGSTIVTIAIGLFLVLAALSPICHSISHSEVNLEVVVETPECNIKNLKQTNSTFLKKLLASDGEVYDEFGRSVSVFGDTIVVGAYLDNVGANSCQGSAYVFERNEGGADNWGEVTTLTTLDGAEYDRFGRSVSVFGDTIVVGAYYDDIGPNDYQGSAYVFERNEGGPDNWGQVTKLTALDGAAGDRFGVSVSVHNDTIVVGAWYKVSAYVFERNLGGADNWGQVTNLTILGGAAGDYFGYSVSIYEDTIVVGAVYDEIGANFRQGSAYVFERNQGGADVWGQVAKLTALDGAAEDRFGISVSVFDDTIVVGARGDDVGTNDNQGSAYVFERNQGGAGNWGEVTKLTALDGAWGDRFGYSVSVFSDTIVVGAKQYNVWGDDLGCASFDEGAAYVFERNQGGADNWGEVTKLTTLDGAQGDCFGVSISVFGETIVVGANGSNVKQGAAYVFEQTTDFVIPLAVGWNLISLPLIQNNTSIDNVLSSINGTWDYIQAYNATDPDHWKTIGTFKPDQLNDLKLLNHKIGFWVNITEPGVELVVLGNVSISTSIPLYAGWNLVGYPSLTNETVANTLWGTGADRVEVFDPAEPYRIKEVGPSYVMKPGEGYWVHVPADTTWMISW